MAGNARSDMIASLRARIADDRPACTAFALTAIGECSSAYLDLTNGYLTVTVEGGSGVDNVRFNLDDPQYNTLGRLVAALQRKRGYKVTLEASYVADHPSSDLSVEGIPDLANGGTASLRHRIFSDGELERFINEAIVLHNPNFPNATAVPKAERPYVLMKAAAAAYRTLAADSSKRKGLDGDANLFLSLARDQEKQYENDHKRQDRILQSPKTDTTNVGSGDAIQGHLHRFSLRTGAKAHSRDALPPTPPKLFDYADDDIGDTTIRLRWQQSRDNHFSHYEVWRDTQPNVERSIAGRLGNVVHQLPPQSQYSQANTAKQVLGSVFSQAPVSNGFFFWTAAEANGSLVNATFIDGVIANAAGVAASVAGEPLEPDTDYYYRVYLINRNGEIVSSEVKRYRTKPMRARFKRTAPGTNAAVSHDAMSVYTGPLSGGTEIVVKGTAFRPGVKLTIGGKECALTVDSSTQITAISPLFANPDFIGRRLDVVLRSPDGLTDILQATWTYQADPEPEPEPEAETVQEALGERLTLFFGENYDEATGTFTPDVGASTLTSPKTPKKDLTPAGKPVLLIDQLNVRLNGILAELAALPAVGTGQRLGFFVLKTPAATSGVPRIFNFASKETINYQGGRLYVGGPTSAGEAENDSILAPDTYYRCIIVGDDESREARLYVNGVAQGVDETAEWPGYVGSFPDGYGAPTSWGAQITVGAASSSGSNAFVGGCVGCFGWGYTSGKFSAKDIKNLDGAMRRWVVGT